MPMFFATLKHIKMPAEKKIEKGYIVRSLSVMTGWTFGRGRYAVLIIAGILLLFGIVSSMQLKYGDANPGSPILWQDSPYNVDTANINSRFPGVDQMWVVFESSATYPAVAQPDLMQGMESLKQYIIDDPNVGHAVSLADLVKSIRMLA